MQDKKTALITGASGLVGNALLHLLLADDAYKEVRVLGRSSLEMKHPKLKEQLLQLEHMNEFAALFEVDDMFCCLGTTIKKAGSEAAFQKVDQEYPLNMAQLAREKNVGHFIIVTAMGANSSSMIFYNKVKGQVEAAIKDLKLNATSICRPSLLLGKRKESRLGENLASVFMKISAPLMLGPLKKYRAIEAKTLAKAMLQIAKSNKNGFKIYLSDELEKIGSAK